MTATEKALIAEAARVPDWDIGIGENLAAAPRRASEAASDFDFGAIVNSSPAVAASVGQPQKLSLPEPVFHDEPSQLPSVSFADRQAAAREKVDRAYALLTPAPARDNASSHPFMVRALKSPAVKSALKAAQVEQLKYKAVLKETGPIIGKEQAAADCLAAIANCSDLAQLEKLRHLYAETQGPAAEAARQSARRICRVAYTKLEAALHNLVDLTVAELDTIAPEIEGAEVTLFAEFGFPHRPTGLMNHLHEIKRRVSHHKATLELNAGPNRVNSIIPSPGEEVLSTFGV